jgi:outer membrane protein OmpA-like peptidoglycan-associated protein
VALGCSRRADAQVIEQIKQRAKQRADARKKKLDSTMVQSAGQVIDSSVEKTGRGVDAVVNTAGTVVDTVLNKTEHGVSGVFNQRDGDAAGKLAAQLAKYGRAVVPELEFQAKSDTLTPAGERVVKQLATALQAIPGVFLIEGYTEPGSDPGADQALSERRAEAVKERLVVLGIPVTRLFRIGYGATRPLVNGATTILARIEVAKMQ